MKKAGGMRRLRAGAWLGLGLGLLGALLALSPAGLWLEEGLGLSWLFAQRGARPAPPQVAVVTIDRESADRLGLANLPRTWPRQLHARLIEQLARAGVRSIAFDIFFAEPREPEGDAALVRAVAEAGNVVLFEQLRKEIRPLEGGDGSHRGLLTMERGVPPFPALAEAAAGLAPFALPKVPVLVSQGWLFKPEAGDAPTLPLVALGVYAAPALAAVEAAVGLPPMAEARYDQRLRRLRQALVREPSNARRLAGGQAGARALLLEVGAGPHSRYLNFYGPPRSIATFPYHRVLDGDPETLAALRGRAVFVGFSEERQPEQRDGFYTVFSDNETGLDIAGVEIAATTLANLLDGSALRPLSATDLAALLLAWGLLLGLALRSLGAAGVLLAGTALGLAYVLAARYGFERHYLWPPLVVPLLVQLPLGMLGALVLGYRGAQRERERIRAAFGYHLPPAVVDELARGIDLRESGREVYGICLATDAERYTELSERMRPAELREFMNAYYAAVFTPVRRHGGVVADIVGDAMLAVWAARAPDAALRARACAAALQVLEATRRFNEGRCEALPTRLGLHCGPLVLGHVGALDHYEYRAVGDIVNTAARLEGLCKRLGVQAVASAAALEGVTGLAPRELGAFQLAGKSRPVVVHELLPEGALGEAPRAAFAEGLAAFRAGRYDQARAAFARCDALLGGDGPARFYLRLCAAETPAEGRAVDGVVRLAVK